MPTNEGLAVLLTSLVTNITLGVITGGWDVLIVKQFIELLAGFAWNYYQYRKN